MKKLFFIIACLGLALFVGCASPDEKANKLFLEASQLVKEAQEVERTSYSDAFKLYEEALSKLERLTSKYPSSQLAVRLARGEAKIESYPITVFKETILSQAKMRSDAEGSPLACAILVARTIEPAFSEAWALAEIAGRYAEDGQYERALLVAKTIEDASSEAWALAKVAGEYAEAGQKDKASEILSQAIQVAKTIERAPSKACALAEIAGEYAEAGEKDKGSKILSQALQVTKTIEDASSKVGALAEMAGKYAEAGEKDKVSEILSQALQVAKTIEYAYYKVIALAEIAGKYVETGQKVDDRARKILHEIIREVA